MPAPELPDNLSGLFTELMREPLKSPGILKARVLAHRARIDQAAIQNEYLDVNLAYRLVNVCFALLREFKELDEDDRHAVQAACGYFALTQDRVQDDFKSMVGLDDDARVVNYVCRRLHRVDLLIDLD